MRQYLNMKWFSVLVLLMLMASCGRTDVQPVSSTRGPSLAGQTANGASGGSNQGDGVSGNANVMEETLSFDENSPVEEKGNGSSFEGATPAELEAIKEFVGQDIFFAYDSFKIDEKSQKVLESKARWLRQNSFAGVIIEGHCDDRGTTEYNLSLGERRAESVKSFLADLGVAVSRMTLVSYGEERPAVPGSDEAARARNRRAHCEIK